MTTPDNPFYGIPINEIVRICRVDPTTARRWKRRARRPPESAILLIQADLGMFDPEWRGWRIRGATLVSPEGWEITENDIRAVPLLRLQIVAYQGELRRIRDTLKLPEQPSPESWPEWVNALK